MSKRFPAHITVVWGSIVIFGSICILLLTLLYVPVRIQLALDTTLRGGRGMLTLRFLCLKKCFGLRVHGLEEPYLSIEILGRNGKTDRIIRAVDPPAPDKPSWRQAVRYALRIQRAEADFCVGILHAPAETALACGALSGVTHEVLSALIPGAVLRINAMPSFQQNVFRIRFTGIASAKTAHIIKERLTLRGDESHGASNGNHYAKHGAGAQKSR